MVEGGAHGSNGSGGNCIRKLELWTRSLAVEEALVLCISGGGNCKGSDDSEGSCYAQHRVYVLGSCEEGHGGRVCVHRLYSLDQSNHLSYCSTERFSSIRRLPEVPGFRRAPR